MKNIKSGQSHDEVPEFSKEFFVGEGEHKAALTKKDAEKLKKAIGNQEEKQKIEKKDEEQRKKDSIIESLKTPENIKPGTALSVYDGLRRAMLMQTIRIKENPQDETAKQKLERLEREQKLLSEFDLRNNLSAMEVYDAVQISVDNSIEELKKTWYSPELKESAKKEEKTLLETAQRLQERLVDEANRSAK